MDEQTPEMIEHAFRAALAANPGWTLGDNGTMDTVLVCTICGDEEAYQSREDATFWLDGLECSACYYARVHAR